MQESPKEAVLHCSTPILLKAGTKIGRSLRIGRVPTGIALGIIRSLQAIFSREQSRTPLPPLSHRGPPQRQCVGTLIPIFVTSHRFPFVLSSRISVEMPFFSISTQNYGNSTLQHHRKRDDVIPNHTPRRTHRS